MNSHMTSVQIENSESTSTSWRWRSIPLGVRMMFVVAGALFAMAFTMMGVQAQTTVSNTVCLPVALPLSGAETRAVNSEPTLNFEGSRASFWSTANPVGDNTDRSIEIFSADTSVLTGTTAPPISQVTVSRGNILGGFNVMPDMLTYVVAGTRHSLIVFASDRDYEPAGSSISNPDGGFEIFLAQTEPTLKIWQLTDTSRSASIMPTISNIIPEFNSVAGRYVRIAYLSDADGAENTPKATNNADRNYEVHTMLVNVTPLELAAPGNPVKVNGQQFQLTRTSLDTVNDQPTVSANGTHVVFLSNASTGLQVVNTLSNADRNREVFVSTVAAAPNVIQVTKSSAGDNDAPDINDNGTRVAFASTVTNYPPNAATPGTTAGAQSIYLARLDSAGVTGLSRISSAVRAPNGTSAPAHPITAKEPAISNDGRRVVFSANGCDPSVTANACNQPVGLFQVFVVDQQSSSQTAFTMARVTNSITRTHELPSVSGNGQRIALVTTQESSVDNPDLSGSEIVALECRQALLGARMSMNTVSDSLLENRPDVGDTVAFQVTLENTTFVDFSGTMVMTDTLPPGMTFLNATIVSEPAGSSIDIGLFNTSTRKLVWTVDDLGKLTDATIEIRARVNALEAGLSKTNIVNIATDADLEAQGITNFIDTASVDYRVTQVDLRSNLAVNNTLPRESEVYTYTISVTNPITVAPGSSGRVAGMDPATKIVVTTTLATLLNQMEYVGTSSTGAIGAVSYNSATGIVSINRVDPGTTAQVRLGFRPLAGAGGQAPRTVSITGIKADQEDIAAANNIGTGTRTIRVIGTDLATVSLTPNQTIPPQGSTIVYALTVRNRGPLPNTPNPPTDSLVTGTNADRFAPPFVRARAVIPLGITVTGVSDGGAAVVGASGTDVTWNFAGNESLEIGENHTLFITGTVTAGPGENLTVQAGDLQALFDPSGLQAMNDPVPSNNGLISSTVKVNSTATIAVPNPPEILEGLNVTLPVTYTDVDLGDTHVIQVNWGDGSAISTSPVLTRPVGISTRSYSFVHPYADDPPGVGTENYTIVITVTDNTGNAVVQPLNYKVFNDPPHQTYLNITGQAKIITGTTYLALINQPISMTVRFTDTGYSTAFSSETFNYFIKWGTNDTDTTAAVGTVTNGAVGTPTRGEFSVQHTFDDFNGDAPFEANINVTDDDMALNSNTQRPVRFIVDQRPTAVDDVVYLLEGETVAFNVITNNDTDNHPANLVLSNLSSTGLGGTLVSFDPTGVITYTGDISGLSSGQVQTDTITYEIKDEYDLLATAKIRFVVTGVNEGPVVDLNGGTAGIDVARAFVEDAGAITLSPAGTLTDNDGQGEIQTLVATITNPVDDSFEMLSSGVFANVNASWDDINHVLTLTKVSGTPDWDAVLRSVQYNNNSADPDPTPRLIQFVATDNSAADSAIATATVSVTAVDDAPIIVMTTTVGAVNEGFSVQVDAALRISDTDTLIWDGGKITATVTSAVAQDALQVVPGGLVSISEATTINYDGVEVGFTSGGGTGQLVITFNAAADNEAVQAVARQIAYGRLSGPISANPRTVTLAAKSSPVSLLSNTPSRNFTVTYTNDAPVITLTDLAILEDIPTNVRANIHVSDSDAGTNNLRMRLQASAGTITVSGLGAALTGNGTSNVLITNTVTALDASGIISYTPPSNIDVDQVITVTVNDLGNTGGAPQVTSAVLHIDVIPVNDAPTLDLNGAFMGADTMASYTENAGFTGLGVSNAVIGDIDSTNMSAVTVTLPVGNPGDEFLRVTVGATGIITSYNPSTGILLMSGSASLPNYQTVLRTLAYRNLSDNPTTAPRNITVVVADDGGLQSPTRTIVLTVTAQNDVPVLDLNGLAAGIDYSAAFIEDFGPVAVMSTTATLVDLDNMNLASASATLTNRPDGGVEFLSGTSSGGVTVGSYNASTGVLALSGSAPLSDYLTVLKSIRYNNTSDQPTTTARVIEFRVTDPLGGLNTPLPKTTLSITPTNDPTQIDLNGTDAGFGFSGTYTEDAAAVAIVKTGMSGLSISDPDGPTPNFLTATIKITNQLDGTAEVLSVGGGPTISASYNGGTGTLTLTGSANATIYQNRLRQATYINNSNTPNTTPRQIVFQIWDTTGLVSAPITSTISIVAVNDAPSVTLLTPTGIVEDTPADLQPFVTVADPDAGAGNLTLALTVTHGILNVSGDVTVTDDGSDVIQATGTITGLNEAVYSFEPDPDYNGSAALSARINDNGNSPAPAKSAGAGPANFTIAADNDAPTLNVSSPTGVSEDVSTNIRSFIQVADIDANPNPVRMQVTVASGTLTGSGTGLTFGGNGTSSVVMTGTLTNLNAGPLNFLSAPDMSGGNTITVTVNDLGNTGAGGQKTVTSAPIAFNVDAVNDAPIIVITSPTTVMEDQTFDMSPSIAITDVDAAAGMVRVRVTVATGTLNASGSGLTIAQVTPASVLITGTLTSLDAAVINFLSAANLSGSNTITATISDLGNTGSGGAKGGTSGAVAFTVNAVNDPPVVTFNTPTGVQEDLTYNLGADLSVSDVDAGGNLLRMRVTVATGTLSASGTGLTIEQVTPASVLVTGTVTNLDASVINFLSASNMNGTNTITVTVNDRGFTGAGGPQVTTAGPTNFTVNPVDDAPSIAVNTGITVTSAATTPITAGVTTAMLSATDIDSADTAIVYTVRALPGAAGVVLRKSGSAMAVCNTFTQSELAGGAIDFTIAGSVPRPTDTTFTFVVANAADCVTATPVAFNIRVRAP